MGPSWKRGKRKWRSLRYGGPEDIEDRNIPNLHKGCPPEWLQLALKRGLDPNGVLDDDCIDDSSESSDGEDEEGEGGQGREYAESPEDDARRSSTKAALNLIRWPSGFRPLHYFVHHRNNYAVELFLWHKADPNLYSPLGRTALHEAVAQDQESLVELLLDSGADVNSSTIGTYVEVTQDGDTVTPVGARGWRHGGETPMQIALRNSSTKTIPLLVEAGARLTTDSQQQQFWTPLDIALLAEDWKMMTELIHLGQRFSAVSSPTGLNIWPELEGDTASLAQQLLATVRGDILIPPDSLYPLYCDTLWRAASVIDISLTKDMGTLNTDELICEFFGGLELRARARPQQNGNGRKERPRRMLCFACLEFQSYTGSYMGGHTQAEFLLYETRRQLNESAKKGCSLCGIIADALDHEQRVVHGGGEATINSTGSPSGLSMDLPVHLWISKDTAAGAFGRLHARCGVVMPKMYIRKITRTRSLLPSSKDVDTGTDLSASLQKASKWLDTCRGGGTTHERCRVAALDYESRLVHPPPRRLLHIENPTESIRLVDSEHVEGRYCALSYCWGNKRFFTTTHANLEDNMEGFSLDVLPPLFQDAVQTAWSLGYKYMWIDALCIIQDSAEDWAHESRQMGTIYANADLTISTLVARDCFHGLFQPWAHEPDYSASPVREPHAVPIYVWQPKAERRSDTSLVVHPASSKWPPDVYGPVHSRAWTLQEQLLSRRILWFGSDMLQWECLSEYKTEAEDDEAAGKQQSPVSHRRQRSSEALKQEMERRYGPRADIWKRIDVKVAVFQLIGWGESTSSSKRIFDLWKDQLEEFMRRDITRSSDRLAAITSFSQRLATVSGNSFQDGLWVGDKLIESMCWRVVKPRAPQLQQSNNGMPSWPWAAIEGEVSFDILKNAWLDNVKFRAVSLISLGIQANETQGRVCSSITLKAALCRKRPWRAGSLKPDHPSVSDHLRSYYGLSGPVFLDHDVDDVADCYAINLSGVPGLPSHCRNESDFSLSPKNEPTIRYLMQKVAEPNVFRRVGIGILLGKPYDMQGGRSPGATTPSNWLAIDEEVFEDAEIVIV